MRGEALQLLHASQLATPSEVPGEQQNPDAKCILLLLVWAGVYSIWGDLEEFIWIVTSIEMIQPIISIVKSHLKLLLKLDPKLLILISIVEISFLWECFSFHS